MPAPQQTLQQSRFGKGEMLLLFVAFVWGGSFLLLQQALKDSGPLGIMAFRFASAFFITLLLSWNIMKDLSLHELFTGACIGIGIFCGYSLQTAGLQYIPSSKSGFITAMYVPIVPILQWAVLKRPPGLMSWLGSACAFVGLIFIAGPTDLAGGFGKGELITLLGALGMSAEIILISLFAHTVSPKRVTVIQLGTASVLAFCTMPVFHESLPRFTPSFLVCIAILAMTSSLSQLAMNWAQRQITATKATLIYSSEPVWAGIIGRIAGERLPFLALVGGGLIVLGVLVSELRLPPQEKRKR